MSPYLMYLGFAFQLVATGLWVGGLVFLIWIASPLVFRECSTKIQASQLQFGMLHRFHTLEIIAALASLSGGGFLYLSGINGPLLYSEIVLSLLMFFLYAYYAGYLLPRIEDLRIKLRDEEMFAREPDPTFLQRFLQLHALHMQLMRLNAFFGALLLLLIVGLAIGCATQSADVGTELWLPGLI